MSNANIRWLGHAAIELTLSDERVILIDPWLRDNPSCPDELKSPVRCDFLVFTHGHGDHTGDASDLIKRFNPHVVAAVELCQVMGLENPKARFAPMNIGGTQTIDGVEFSMTRAFHSSSIDGDGGPMYTGMPAGVVVSPSGLAGFYHAGDTDVFSDMRLIAELFQPAIAALPIGDHFTMGPRGAAIATKLLNVRQVIPIHFGTFPVLHGTVDAFRQALGPEMSDRLVTPTIGASMSWTSDGIAAAARL